VKKKFKIAILALLFIGVVAWTAWFIRAHDIVVMNPKGMIGVKERDLIVTASLLMLIVVIPVFALTWFFAWKYREGKKSEHAPDWEHNYIAEYCWWGVPFVIIVILGFITWKSSHELSPFRPIESDKKPVTIQAIALQWKWLFIYPEWGIATVNYIRFPEKTPINFEITADAPMNSFWIPQLGGQIYAMPAMRTKLHLIADEIGTFRGASANLSGKGFAGMNFVVESSTQQDFDAWVKSVKGSSKYLGWEEYKILASPSEYQPAAFYRLTQENLFDRIIMKYMSPE
jgi:cytochrome o ubiquinol oxidase subunit 2